MHRELQDHLTLKLLKTPFPRGETEGKEQQKGSTLIIEEFSARPSLLGNTKETGKTQKEGERQGEEKKLGVGLRHLAG